MERRKAVIAAATASLTLLAGAAAISLNTGIVGASGDGGVGQISPVDPAVTSGAVYVDEPAAAGAQAPGQDRAGDDEDGFEDSDGSEDDGAYDDRGGDDHDEDHDDEYEGADDDD
ncbi:MAG TPA: hypothetical protein VFM27_09650 [Acidimicrobiales bacterium]|nr:hypothetical protein [Acidimicrobiales bacterium]